MICKIHKLESTITPVHVTYKDSHGQHKSRNGSSKPDAPGWRVNGALPTYASPNSVQVPVTSATQTEFRARISPGENQGKIDSCWDKKEK
jgi:hypothetical protein